MARALRLHWPEYLMEAAELGLFMISACLFGVLLEHPISPARQMIADDSWRRLLMGVAMGLTAVAIIYSPLGKRSGGHFNPAVTLTFYRLGKIDPHDALFYAIAQFTGAVAGVLIAAGAVALVADPEVNYVATVPGPTGVTAAFVAEALISFVLMSTILAVSNTARIAHLTPIFAGVLVAAYITFEAPFSGMSMNPARTFGSALPANLWTSLWIYFTAPPLGMLLAAELFARRKGLHAVLCAKLHHDNPYRCIFRCGYEDLTPPCPPFPRTGRGEFDTESSFPSAARRGERRWNRIVANLALILALALTPVFADATTALEARAVDSVGIVVSDLDRSTDFFTQVLAFEKVGENVTGEQIERVDAVGGSRLRTARLRLGDESIDLIQFPSPAGRPIPVDSRSNDLWFQHIAIIVRDIDAAYARLRAHSVEPISSAPQRLPDWNPNAGGIRAFYFKDPDGHALEILEFPPGKGAAKWHEPSDRIFLGVDHTAIAVDDTERSLGFYRDHLGLRVAGESLNHGIEQERLAHVAGARVRITGLRAPAGPGIEFLEYLSPADGRPRPPDSRPEDLLAWRTRIRIDDTAAAERLLKPSYILLSFDPIDRGAPAPTSPILSLRDPDGHIIELREAASRP